MAERARAGLGGALVEREDGVLRRHVGHEVGELRARRRVFCRHQLDPFDIGTGLERRANVAFGRRRAAIERVLDRRAQPVTGEIGAHIGRAHGDAGIVRHRRHPEMQAACRAPVRAGRSSGRNARAAACCRAR